MKPEGLQHMYFNAQHMLCTSGIYMCFGVLDSNINTFGSVLDYYRAQLYIQIYVVP